MTKVKLNKDGKHLELDGENYKITYNETSVMLKKREVKSGGIAETIRKSFCGHPNKLKEMVSDGWNMVSKPYNWKHIIQERHNCRDGINKVRKELELQAQGMNGEGRIYNDEETVETVTENIDGNSKITETIKKTFDAGKKWLWILICLLIALGLTFLIVALRAKRLL